VLYFGLIIGVAIQVYRVYKNTPPTWQLKIVFGVIVAVFSAFRGVYMALPPSTYGGDSIAILFVFEFPSFIFFVMFTTVLYLWAQVLYRVRTMKRKAGQIKIVWRLYLGVNIAMFAIFVVFVIIYYTITEDPPLPCQQGDIGAGSKNKFTTNLAYLIFIGIIVLILAIVYMLLGFFFIRQIGKTSKKGLIMQMTLMVTGTFVPMFIIKSALILWSATTNGVVPLIVFSLLEILPAAVLLYYILPQLASGSEAISMTRSNSTSTGGMKSLRQLDTSGSVPGANASTMTASAVGQMSTSTSD